MKKVGRPFKPFTEKELQAVQEYLNSDKSYKEIAEKYDMTISAMQYRVGKYKRQLEKETANETSEM